jgi:hypothetical protein
MFAYHGIELTKAELVSLFNQVDRDGSGDLNLDEFKSLAQDSKANQIFKTLILRVRAEHEKRFG